MSQLRRPLVLVRHVISVAGARRMECAVLALPWGSSRTSCGKMLALVLFRILIAGDPL